MVVFEGTDLTGGSVCDGNTIASRVDMNDDASRTGKVYVGYCGPFLNNTRT